MPGSFRDGRFALGLTLGVCLTLIFSFAAIFPGGPPDDFGQPNADAYRGEQVAQQDERWWLIRRVVYMDDTAAQWIMTFATIFAAYLLLMTLWATQKMAADTQRIGEAQVRAYLSITRVIVKVGVSQGRVWWNFFVTIRNSGQSPAIGVSIRTELRGDEHNYGLLLIDDLDSNSDTTEEISRTTEADRLTFSDPDQTRVHLRLDVTVSAKDVFDREIKAAGTFDGHVYVVRGTEADLRRMKAVMVNG